MYRHGLRDHEVVYAFDRERDRACPLIIADIGCPVHEHIGIIQQLRSAATGADRRALLYLQAQYGEFASWLHHDAGDFRMAQHWTDRALEWSQTAGDPEMTAYILARKSQLAGDWSRSTRWFVRWVVVDCDGCWRNTLV